MTKVSGVMYYQSKWATPTTVGAVLVDGDGRQAGGNIYVSTTAGPDATTSVATFAYNPDIPSILHLGASGAGIYALKTEVNSSTDSTYYQIGDVELLAKDPGRNLAQGAPTISSGFFVKGGTGSVTDMDYNSRMQLSLTGSEWYVGFEYAGNAVQTIGAIRISTGATDTTTWSWRDSHVEYEDAGGNWIDLGQASIPAGQSNYWVDLGTTVNARGVRLYASTAFGNAPTAQDVVDEIMVFAPEPTSLSLLALGGLAALRRRSRRA